jgi:hypothetical protein
MAELKLSDHYHKSKTTTIVISSITIALCLAKIDHVKSGFPNLCRGNGPFTILGIPIDITNPFWVLAFFAAALASCIALCLNYRSEVARYKRDSVGEHRANEIKEIVEIESKRALEHCVEAASAITGFLKDNRLNAICNGENRAADYEKIRRLLEMKSQNVAQQFSVLSNEIFYVPENEKDIFGRISSMFEVRLNGIANSIMEFDDPVYFFLGPMDIASSVAALETQLKSLNASVDNMTGDVKRYLDVSNANVRAFRWEAQYNFLLPLGVFLLAGAHVIGRIGYGQYPSVMGLVNIWLPAGH